MVLKLFKEHNDQVENLVGKDFAPLTAVRYKTAKMRLEEYIKKEYNMVFYTASQCCTVVNFLHPIS